MNNIPEQQRLLNSKIGAPVSENILKTLAKKIRYHRKNRGLTQVQLSMDSGVEHRHLQKIEAGTVDLRLGTIAKIAKSLNVPTSYLLEDFVPVSVSDEEAENKQPIELMSEVNVPVAAISNDLRFLYVNNAFYKEFGYSREKVIEGLSLKDVLADPEESAIVDSITEDLLEKKPQSRPFLMKMRTSEGRVVQKLVQWNYAHGPDKKVVGFVVLYLDPSPKEVLDSMKVLKEEARS